MYHCTLTFKETKVQMSVILKRPKCSFFILRKEKGKKRFYFISSPLQNFKYRSMLLLLAILDTIFFSLD